MVIRLHCIGACTISNKSLETFMIYNMNCYSNLGLLHQIILSNLRLKKKILTLIDYSNKIQDVDVFYYFLHVQAIL